MFENNKLCLQNIKLELFCNMFWKVPEVGNIIILYLKLIGLQEILTVSSNSSLPPSHWFTTDYIFFIPGHYEFIFLYLLVHNDSFCLIGCGVTQGWFKCARQNVISSKSQQRKNARISNGPGKIYQVQSPPKEKKLIVSNENVDFFRSYPRLFKLCQAKSNKFKILAKKYNNLKFALKKKLRNYPSQFCQAKFPELKILPKKMYF